MNLHLHTVLDPARRDTPSSVVAREDRDWGLAAQAHGRVVEGDAGPELAHAAAELVLDTLFTQVSRDEALLKKLHGALDDPLRRSAMALLADALNIASREVHIFGRRQRTTFAVVVDAVLCQGEVAFLAHIGDGRCYLGRKGLVHRLTQDHVTGATADAPTPESTPSERRLTRACGLEQVARAETMSLHLSAHDRILLLSPGLVDAIDELHLGQLADDPQADGAAARILTAAREAGANHDLGVLVGDVRAEGVRRSRRHSRLATLARIPLFAYCTEPELLAIAGCTRPVKLPPGALVFRQGDAGQELYLVVAGQLTVEKDGEAIAALGPGSNFGEMALLDEPRRSASVRVAEDAELLVIHREAFFRLLKSDPTLAVKVLWNMLLELSSHLRQTSSRLAGLERERGGEG